MAFLHKGYILQRKVPSASNSGSLGFIVCLQCCRMVDSAPIRHTIFILYPWTMDTQRGLFFKNSKLLGLGRQIGLKFYEAFGVFMAKLKALFWRCESLVHGKV